MSDASRQRSARWKIAGGAIVLIVAGAVLWRYTPLAELASAERVGAWMQDIRSSSWAPLIVFGAFVIGGLVMFPLTLLIAATAVVFDAWLAITLSLTGAIGNAVLLYVIGRTAMRDTVTHAFGTYVEKLRGALDRSGIIAVATIRMVPIAPFTLVNLAAGAIEIRIRDYVLGTLLGILPGTIVLTAFGHQVRRILENPSPKNIGLLAAAILAWIALSLGLQRLVSRRPQANS